MARKPPRHSMHGILSSTEHICRGADMVQTGSACREMRTVLAHGYMTWVPSGAILTGTEGGVLSPPFPNPAKLKFRLTALYAPR